MAIIKEVRLHGRGGQGSVTAAELVAVAAFYDGLYSQAFPNFGVERRGAPVTAYARLSEAEIRLREQIYNPNFIIIQDATLIGNDSSINIGIKKAEGVLVNSEKKDWPEIENKNIYAVPATKIALEKIGKPFINTALIGAFIGMSKLITVASLERAIRERFPEKVAELNVVAMKAANEYVLKNY